MNLSQCRPTGGPTIFSTSGLSQRLVQPKSGFDLTDPNGYKLPSLYSNLNDPNLRTYFHRRDIHDHLRTNGFITKDDKVICSMKEFNKYTDHLAEVQLDWDQRFRAEQKELVRMVLSMQNDGKLSSDVPIADVMEWILFEGRDMATQELHKDKDRPERQLRTGVCSRTKLPKIHTQTALSYPDSRSDQVRPKRHQAIPRNPEEMGNISDQIARSRLKAWRSKGCNMLKQVITEVQREMRLETLKSKASKEERDKKKQGECKRWTAEKCLLERVAAMSSHLTDVRNTVLQEEPIRSLTCIDQGLKKPTLTKLNPRPNIKKQGERKGRAAESVAEMSGHLTNVRNTVLKEEQIRSLTCIDQGVKKPTFTKLKPLPNIKRNSGFDDNMAEYTSKDPSIFLPTNITSSPKVLQTNSDLSVLEKRGSEVHMDSYSDGDLHTRLSSPTLSDIAVDLVDDVLNELKITPDVVLRGDIVVPESSKFELKLLPNIKLKPLPNIKRNSGFDDNMAEYTSKDPSIFLPTNTTSSPKVSQTNSDVHIDSYSDGDLHTRLSSPTLSDIAVDLVDDVLNELKMTW